jgi:hypothetical protein
LVLAPALRRNHPSKAPPPKRPQLRPEHVQDRWREQRRAEVVVYPFQHQQRAFARAQIGDTDNKQGFGKIVQQQAQPKSRLARNQLLQQVISRLALSQRRELRPQVLLALGQACQSVKIIGVLADGEIPPHGIAVDANGVIA